MSYFRDTSDIAVFCDKKILLARDVDSGLWEFPGGKVFQDPTDTWDAQSLFERHLGLDLDWFRIKIFDRIERTIVDPESLHVTFLRETDYYDCRKWKINLEGLPSEDYDDEEDEDDEDDEEEAPKYCDWKWFSVHQLPDYCHQQVYYVRDSRPELFRDPHLDPNYISEADWYDEFILPAGTVVWHGAHKVKAEKALEKGYLSGSTWTVEDQSNKTSAGTLDEVGLLWFFANLSPCKKIRGRGMELAEGFARGAEARRWCQNCHSKKEARDGCTSCSGTGYRIIPEKGKVFEAIISRDMRIAHRHSKLLTERESMILDQDLNIEWDKIRPGDTLSSAVNKFFKYRRVGFAHVLPLLGYDGISYSEHSLALLLDHLDYTRVFRRT